MRKVHELVTVGACVYLVMSMEGWVGAGMEVVIGMHAGKSRGAVVCRDMPEHFQNAR